MRYFFVFQNKSYHEERSGGFLWAPKVNENGQTFHHWTSMTLLRKGDVIFSSFKGELLSIIVAKDDYKDARKPSTLKSVDLWEIQLWVQEDKSVVIKCPVQLQKVLIDLALIKQ